MAVARRRMFRHPHSLQGLQRPCSTVLFTAGDNQSVKPLTKKKALFFHGISSSSLNHKNSSSDHSILTPWILHVCKSYFFRSSPLLPQPEGQRCSSGTKLELFNRNKQRRSCKRAMVTPLFCPSASLLLCSAPAA